MVLSGVLIYLPEKGIAGNRPQDPLSAKASACAQGGVRGPGKPGAGLLWCLGDAGKRGGGCSEIPHVGPDELTRPDAISIDSPLARALLKKTIDDEVAVRTERGLVRYWILEIDYRR